jgi:uncharacterized membrane protein HdeD (DUF308 family)
MSTGHEFPPAGSPERSPLVGPSAAVLHREFQHLRSHWCWFFALGILLVICGTAVIVFPAVTAIGSVVAVVVIGVALLVAGVATIVATAWAGHWSGHLWQVLVGLFYVVAGYLILDAPVQATVAFTLMIATLFILIGLFRIVAAFVVRFPHWGWAVLNGAVTFLIGFVIYKHSPQSALWAIGLLVGLEMLLNGWTWIMLSLAIRRIPERTL